jgi:hypothetical protein
MARSESVEKRQECGTLAGARPSVDGGRDANWGIGFVYDARWVTTLWTRSNMHMQLKPARSAGASIPATRCASANLGRQDW